MFEKQTGAKETLLRLLLFDHLLVQVLPTLDLGHDVVVLLRPELVVVRFIHFVLHLHHLVLNHVKNPLEGHVRRVLGRLEAIRFESLPFVRPTVFHFYLGICQLVVDHDIHGSLGIAVLDSLSRNLGGELSTE